MRAGDDLRLADRELEALAPHLLDQDGELQLAAALHLPGVGAIAVEHAQRDVADELLVEAVAHLARGQQLAVEARERRGVDADHHRQAAARRR